MASAKSGLSWIRHGILIIGGAIVVTVLLSAAFAEWITPFSPYDLDVATMLQGPSPIHWFGTDELGRDVLSRTIVAARISVEVALVAVSVGALGGTVIGVLAAYIGGATDVLLMRLMELLFSFPAILLAIVLMASLGTNILNAMIAIGIIFIPGFARLARASTRETLHQQYIEAARAVGMSHLRILAREILPNVVTPLLVEAAVAFAYAVLLEIGAEFSRARRPAARTVVGQHAEHRTRLPHPGALAQHRARNGALFLRPRLQPSRRRTTRHARSAPARLRWKKFMPDPSPTRRRRRF